MKKKKDAKFKPGDKRNVNNRIGWKVLVFISFKFIPFLTFFLIKKLEFLTVCQEFIFLLSPALKTKFD